jgi:hypothetical protein
LIAAINAFDNFSSELTGNSSIRPEDFLNSLFPIAHFFYSQMLRRPATTIKLTPEDILEYDDDFERNSLEKQRELAREMEQEQKLHQQSQHLQPQHQGPNRQEQIASEGLVNYKGIGVMSVTRDERIGVRRNNSE